MKSSPQVDLLMVGGAVNNCFAGVANPFYVTLVLGGLSVQAISVGSFLAYGLPVLVGLLLGLDRWFEKCYRALGWVMGVELLLVAAGVFVGLRGLAAYHLVEMFVYGSFSAGVVYLLQRVKERREPRHKWDRRYAMADAFGYLVGSVLVMSGLVHIDRVVVLFVLTAVQVLSVDVLWWIEYRRA